MEGSIPQKELDVYKRQIWEFGKSLEVEKNKEDSIVYWCYKSKIPVILPGPLDGSSGLSLIHI